MHEKKYFSEKATLEGEQKLLRYISRFLQKTKPRIINWNDTVEDMERTIVIEYQQQIDDAIYQIGYEFEVKNPYSILFKRKIKIEYIDGNLENENLFLYLLTIEDYPKNKLWLSQEYLELLHTETYKHTETLNAHITAMFHMQNNNIDEAYITL